MKTFYCLVHHVVQDGETHISVRVRSTPWRNKENSITVKANRADDAARTALHEFIWVDLKHEAQIAVG